MHNQDKIFSTTLLQGYDKLYLTAASPLFENNFFKNACQAIVLKLDQYNLKQAGPILKRKIFYIAKKDPLLEIGEIYKHSASISNSIDQNILEDILVSEPEFLNDFQSKAYEHGARRFFCWCYKDSLIEKIFINAGLIFCGEFPDLDEIVLRFYKDIDRPKVCKIDIIVSKNEIYESYEKLNPYCSDNIHDFFGIFIHDAQEIKTVKGGIFGQIQATKKGLAYAIVFCLWVDESIQKIGLGKMLMMHTEALLKNHGVQYLQLATNGFQAPGFYKKRGFKLVESCPGYYLLNNGPSSIFDCTKKF